VAKFFSRTVELFLKLPLETLLRRAQVAVLSSPEYRMQTGKGLRAEFEPTVPVGEYRGVIGTIWCIVREEGVREEVNTKKGKGKGKVTKRKGQGVEGLWRGWRVGMWGLVGVWGAGLMGRSANGGEF
jgi:mitochondrial fusion and transport protein UGO1